MDFGAGDRRMNPGGNEQDSCENAGAGDLFVTEPLTTEN
jgi:hypothetical protein